MLGRDCGGGTWTSPSGVLTSPNYPDLYRSRDNCVYFIKVPGAQQITLHVIDLDTEYFKDILEYGIGNRVDWSDGGILGVFEGQHMIPEPVTVHNDTMWFSWTTDRTGYVGRGFKLVYTTGG